MTKKIRISRGEALSAIKNELCSFRRAFLTFGMVRNWHLGRTAGPTTCSSYRYFNPFGVLTCPVDDDDDDDDDDDECSQGLTREYRHFLRVIYCFMKIWNGQNSGTELELSFFFFSRKRPKTSAMIPNRRVGNRVLCTTHEATP